MGMETLRGLWERELQDLYATERQTIDALPGMINAATATSLREALEKHAQRTKLQLERLDLIFKQSGLDKGKAGRPSGIDSIVRGTVELIHQNVVPEVRDAAIIAAEQHIEHYEMAGYGCARTWARQLGESNSAELLQQTLDEEGAADKELTNIAQSGINEEATAGIQPDTSIRSRLRYVDVNDLPDSTRYRDTKVRNRAGEALGRVDGFLVDPSGRPYYMVVDSGGLFVGRRYLVPVGRADYRGDERLFAVDLDKDLLKRYPEFHRDAFLSMRDEEARRYEWRVLEAIDPEAARSSAAQWDYERLPYYRQPDWFDRGLVTRDDRAAQTPTDTSAIRNRPPRERDEHKAPAATHPMFASERRSRPDGGRRAGDMH